MVWQEQVGNVTQWCQCLPLSSLEGIIKPECSQHWRTGNASPIGQMCSGHELWWEPELCKWSAVGRLAVKPPSGSEWRGWCGLILLLIQIGGAGILPSVMFSVPLAQYSLRSRALVWWHKGCLGLGVSLSCLLEIEMSKLSLIKRSGICQHSTRAYQEGIVTKNIGANGIGKGDRRFFIWNCYGCLWVLKESFIGLAYSG